MKILNKYVVVVNPISGSIDKTDLIKQIKSFSNQSNIDIFIYETTGKNDKEELVKIYKNHTPKRVIVAGGDGTFKMVVEALENEEVVYGLIPAGSANGFATDLNIPTAMEDILKVAFHNDISEIDVVEINGMKSLHLSDIGLNALLVKNYENSLKQEENLDIYNKLYLRFKKLMMFLKLPLKQMAQHLNAMPK